jgi:hypothetical protein
MIKEDSQLLDIRLGLPGNLLNTTHEIVKFNSVGAKRHPQCRSESMEVLMVEDDVFRFVTFEVLSGILENLNTVVLEESLLRYMMEGPIEYNIHDDKCLPHVESELVDVVGGNSEHPSFMNCSVAYSISIDVGLTIGYQTSPQE